ncbi:MAG: ADP compounds hydrolase NudE [Halothiobacillaceae bacterium]
MSRTPPRILAVETLASTRHFRVEAVDLMFSNGAAARFERLRGSTAGAVLIVPVRDPDHVLLIREYAAGTERYELGLPKGRIENDEPVLDAALRELREETGQGAAELTYLTTLSSNPAYSGQRTHIVLAESLYPAPLAGDEPEPIEVEPWPVEQIDRLLAGGEFTEARSLAALFLVRDLLRSRQQ